MLGSVLFILLAVALRSLGAWMFMFHGDCCIIANSCLRPSLHKAHNSTATYLGSPCGDLVLAPLQIYGHFYFVAV